MSILKIVQEHGFKVVSRSSLEHERKFNLKALHELIMNNSDAIDGLIKLNLIAGGWIISTDMSNQLTAHDIEEMISMTNADSSLKSCIVKERNHFVLIVSKFNGVNELLKYLQHEASTNAKLEELLIDTNLDGNDIPESELYE